MSDLINNIHKKQADDEYNSISGMRPYNQYSDNKLVEDN